MNELVPERAYRAQSNLPTSGVAFLSLLIFFLVFMSILVGQAFSHSSLLNDPDTYWHVATGRVIWETGSLPQRDQFSWTFEGQRWIAKEWLSQLMLFGAYHLGSWRGVVLITAGAIAFAYALLFAVLSRQMRITVAAGIVMVALILASRHFLARPHVFSFPLVVLWVTGLVRAVEERGTPNWLLLPVMILWANVHAGFTLGLAIAGGLAAEAVFSSERKERLGVAIRWAIFLGAALAAGCLTPYGYEPLLTTYKLYQGQPVEQIIEWSPLNANREPTVELLLLCLLFLSLYFGVKIRFWRLILMIGIIHLMFLHVRIVALFGLITPILIASSLVNQFRFLRLDTQIMDDPALFRLVQRFSGFLASLVVCSFILIAAAAYGSREDISPKKEYTPTGAVDYIQQKNLAGNIYNTYEFGGYLIFRGVKTFIDGRIDQLFLGGFMERIAHAQLDGSFPEMLKQYDISLALVAPNSPEVWQLEKLPGWTKAYSDDISALFIRNPSR
jgi:hypothetical protein